MTQRSKIGVLVAEFFGTAILASAVLAEINAAGLVVNKSWFVAATAGLTAALLTITIGKLSGAHLNPAITIGLWTLRKIETTTALAYIAAQMLGGAVALSLFQYLQNDVIQGTKVHFDWRIFVAEMIGTVIFGFGFAAVVVQKLDGYKAAFAIGTSLMLGAVVAQSASSGFLNPAVALANNSWGWIYVTAPILGSVVGMNIYDLFIASESSFKSPIRLASVKTGPSPVAASRKTIKKSSKKKR